MAWLKFSADYDHHPQVLAMSWHAAQYFSLLLRLAKRFGRDGVIPGKFLTPGYLSSYWRAPPDFPYETVKRETVTCGLVVEGADGSARIDGWGRWQPREDPGASTERVRAFRERKRHETKRNAGNDRVEENRGEESREDLEALSTSSTAPAPADLVWAHWRDTLHPTARVFDTATRKKVEARLAEGFTVDDLRRAIDGCKSNPHNMGANDRGKRYDSLELICRDGAKVTQFRGYLDAPTARGPTKPGFQQITAKDPLDFMHPNIRGKYCDLPIEEARARWLRDGGDTQARSIDDHGTGLRNPGG